MSLRTQLRNSTQMAESVRGFQLEAPTPLEFEDGHRFREALERQKESVVALDCREFGRNGLEKIGLNGEVEGTDYKLSKAAFGDLCNFAKIPVGFIKRLANSNPEQALEVVSSMLDVEFHRGARKAMVVDTTAKRIEGIVGAETYKAISNADVFDYVASVSEGTQFTKGWLQGPMMRTTFVNGDRPVEPQKGDIVQLGASVESAINGDMSVKIASYCERLVCSNGMTRKDNKHTAVIRHAGDVDFNVQRAAVQCVQSADSFLHLMETAASQPIDSPESLDDMMAFIADSRNGGSEKLLRTSLSVAKEEAYTEGRDAGELTLWNMVNGVTAAAKHTNGVKAQARTEQLGFDLMEHFASVN